MSTWGGIGEGLTAGMNNRIALEMRERDRRREQENWDKAFALRERAQDMAQANADRTFAAQREDAANSNERANAELELRRRLGDLDASIKQQDMDLRGRIGELDSALKTEELSDRREDRALRRELQKEQLAGQREERSLRRELGIAELEGKKEDRALRRDEYKGRREDSAADRAFREKEAQRIQGNADEDRALRREQLRATVEDSAAGRELQARGLDIQENKIERDDNYRERALYESKLEADRAYALKKEAQDWQSKKAEEEWRTLQTAREELQSANRERQMQREANQKSMSRQLSLAFQMLEDGGGNQTQLLIDDGSYVDARVLDSQDVSKIFGTDAAKRFAAVYAIDTPDEGTIFRVLNNDGSFMMAGDKPYFNEDARYKIYDRGFGTDAANRIMREAGERRDLGLFAAKEEAKATAHAKAVMMSDQYGEKRRIDAATAILKADDASDADRASALAYLGTVFGTSKAGPSDELAKLKEEQAKRGRKRITNPSANPYLTRSGK